MVLKQACAIFDLVGTLITFYDRNNFVFLGEESIFNTLKELHKEDFRIFILSKNISYKLSNKVKKYLNDNLNVPLRFIYDINALPKNIDYDVSIYCGDEVGKKDPYPPYRIGNVDTFLSKKLNLKFIRPIDLFGQYTIKPTKQQELLIMVGMPASGKSTQASQLMLADDRYVACDTDVMPGYRRDLTIQCARENLLKGHSVIALALNQSIGRRNEFASIARSLGIYVRIAWFVRDGRPFNKVRHTPAGQILPSTFYHPKPVPESVYTRYIQEFEKPTLKECDEIIIVY